jgi:hypothetical protein
MFILVARVYYIHVYLHIIIYTYMYHEYMRLVIYI